MHRSKWQARYEENVRVSETFSDHFFCNRPHGGPGTRTNAVSGIPNAPGIDGTPANIIGSGSERAKRTTHATHRVQLRLRR